MSSRIRQMISPILHQLSRSRGSLRIIGILLSSFKSWENILVPTWKGSGLFLELVIIFSGVNNILSPSLWNKTLILKSPVFSQGDLDRFLIESLSTPDFIIQKLTASFVVYGAIQCTEIAYINWNEVDVEKDGLFNTISSSKERIQAKQDSDFIVPVWMTKDCALWHYLIDLNPFSQKTA